MIANNHQEILTELSDLKCCVLIPTYNNEKTLQKVIESVLIYASEVIIINDGSTDSTSKILENFPKLTQIHFQKNKGKGMALRAGFKKAFTDGFDYAITIDSDGQHYADDIPVFIDELKKNEGALLIGSRNMAHESVPKNSSFGNKFSNFWFWAETGIKLTDTQSGFRLYPLMVMDSITFYTSKFEFEIESIVKVSWRGVEVKNVPIKVLYNDERVSHFRPYKDFARISVLNTWLILVALLYIKPRNLFRKMRKKGFKKFFVENVLKSDDTPKKKSLSIALGIFLGLTPFWGFHGILSLSLAAIFKLNKAIAFGFSNISIPPLIPFIIYGSLELGGLVFGTEIKIDFDNIVENVKLLKQVKEFLVGSFILATLASIIFGTTGYLYLTFRAKRTHEYIQ
ncbi:MAG: DUF2062 domain-containing protein [Flavobacteriaceae bacterium]